MQVENPTLERAMLLLAGLALGVVLGGGAVLLADPNATKLHEAESRVFQSETEAKSSTSTLKLAVDQEAERIKADRKKLADLQQQLDDAITAREAARSSAEEANTTQSSEAAQWQQQIAERDARILELESIIATRDKGPADPPLAPLFGQQDIKRESKGFTLSNLLFKPDKEVIGEITNASGVDCEGAFFNLSIYDNGGGLVEVLTFSIDNFRDGETKPFARYLDERFPPDGRYQFQLDSSY